MSLEKHQLMTTLQKDINNTTIESLQAQIIRNQNYSDKKIRNRCKDSKFIITIILYLIIREGNNMTQITKLQFQIKKLFALLPGFPKFSFNPKHQQRNFLYQILLVSQIIHLFSQRLKIKQLQQLDAQAVFIIIVFLSTDKIISSKCFKLIHQRFKNKSLPFRKQKINEQLQSQESFEESYKNTQLQCFKREVRSIIFPQKKQKKRSIKNESIGLMISKFNHKENICHYSLNKAIRENIKTSEKDFYRIRKCFSQHNTRLTQMNHQQQKKEQKEFKWSKCQLMKTNYVAFCTLKVPSVQKIKSMSNSYLKFKKIRQKTVLLQERRHKLVLKI